jgi:hypothetical protein
MIDKSTRPETRVRVNFGGNLNRKGTIKINDKSSLPFFVEFDDVREGYNDSGWYEDYELELVEPSAEENTVAVDLIKEKLAYLINERNLPFDHLAVAVLLNILTDLDANVKYTLLPAQKQSIIFE